jgi:hypothetical protein
MAQTAMAHRAMAHRAMAHRAMAHRAMAQSVRQHAEIHNLAGNTPAVHPAGGPLACDDLQCNEPVRLGGFA